MKRASRFAYMGGSVDVTPVRRAVWGQAIRRSHTARQDAGPFIGSLSSHHVGIHRVVKASSVDGPTRCQRSPVGSVVQTFCNNLLAPRIPPARMYTHTHTYGEHSHPGSSTRFRPCPGSIGPATTPTTRPTTQSPATPTHNPTHPPTK